MIKDKIKRLPNETAYYVKRDVSLLASSIFTESHLVVEKKFNCKFSILFWFVDLDGQVTIYRSGNEYNKFAKNAGQKCLRDKLFVDKLVEKLIYYTVFIEDFIKKNQKINNLLNNWEEFYKNYRDFFVYHQTVQWSTVYLADLNLKDNKVRGIIKKLDKVYKYNENVAPDVEKYFNKFKIGHLVYNEINKNVLKNIKNKPKTRSYLLNNKKKIILSFEEAKKLHEAIQQKYNKYLLSLKEIKGLVACKGLVKGRVKLIKNLTDLKNCKKEDVLVVAGTRPQYNYAISKIKAIVTDEGGLVSHASILAREFKIPCIVGTKNATKALKNGDYVLVDANKGIVKKL